jgi:hypothetical protein
MPDPVQSTGPAPASEPEPTVIELEPITISASPSSGPPAVPLPVGDIAVECLSKLIGVAGAVAGAASNPVLGGALAFKSALELGQCAAETTNRIEEEASIRHALETCAAAGGTPIGLLPGQLTCAVPKEP